ncbi:MAG: hypothetical protein LBI60_05210 [Bacteroidales bacterium]|jgi:hypothetical protein|nr:hypothetical protein [Bacteroidales bacterium]
MDKREIVHKETSATIVNIEGYTVFERQVINKIINQLKMMNNSRIKRIDKTNHSLGNCQWNRREEQNPFSANVVVAKCKINYPFWD